MKDKNIRFIKKNGRVIPVKVKNGQKFDKDKNLKASLSKRGASASPTITKKEFKSEFNKDAKQDEKLLKTGKSMFKKSLAGTAILGVTALLTRNRGAAIGAGILGLASGSIASQNSNLKSSAETKRRIARGGDYNKKSFVGGRSERARKKARFLSKYMEKGSSV